MIEYNGRKDYKELTLIGPTITIESDNMYDAMEMYRRYMKDVLG